MDACSPSSCWTLRTAALAILALLLPLPATAQNLHVEGRLGVATSTPSVPLQLATCTGQPNCAAGDVSLGGGGFAVFGDPDAFNLAFDDNEIMARENYAASDLYVNKDGGNVYLVLGAQGFTQIGGGSGSSSAHAPLVVEGGSDINIEDVLGQGSIQIGEETGTHMVIDTNEIMVRNGPNSGNILYLNYYDGSIIRVRQALDVTSDISLKDDIRRIERPLDRLSEIRGVTWKWKGSESDARRSMGVVAQDVEKSFPEVVSVDAQDGTKAVRYDALIGALVEGVNALRSENDALRREMMLLRSDMDALSAGR